MWSFGGLSIPFHKGTLLISSPRLAVLNARALFICEASELQHPLTTRHAPANFAQLAVINSSFASLAFVKYRGADHLVARGGLVLLSSRYRRRCRYAVLLFFRICQMVKIDSAPKLSNMPKGEDGQGKGVLFHFINHAFILSLYGYYPNVEYRRFL